MWRLPKLDTRSLGTYSASLSDTKRACRKRCSHCTENIETTSVLWLLPMHEDGMWKTCTLKLRTGMCSLKARKTPDLPLRRAGLAAAGGRAVQGRHAEGGRAP